jgi:hypothetical protein
MKDTSVNIRRLLLLVTLVLLIIPFFQAKFNIIKIAPLKGAITEPEKKYFNAREWFSGTYQEQEEKYLNETFGFRSLFIRINNQIAFSLFNKAKANGVIIGKKNYLFEENYIKAYYGTDFIGYDSIKHRMHRLKYIQDTLTKLNKNIILVFAAGKGSFYSEYFPENYKTDKKKTNYETHVELAKQMGIPFIDFNKYFLENKNKSQYPLYPQYGIHWSYYGMYLAADSIIRFIENIRNIDMPNLYWNEVDICQPKESDYDIADGMNILYKLKSFNMAYPNIQIQSDSGKTKPSVLVVSDSYFWGMFNFGITNAFKNSHFWFYNKQIFPDSYQSPVETSQIILKDEIAKHDVIIIMATEATLPGFGWGFIENTFNLFQGDKSNSELDVEYRTKIVNLRNYIKTDKNWMEQIEKKAALNKVSVDSMITLDAIWQIRHEK